MDFREKSLSRGTAGHRSLGKEDAGDCRPRARATSAAESAGTRPVSRPATSPPGLPGPRPPRYTLQSFSGKFSVMRWSP